MLTGSVTFDQVFAAAPGVVGKTFHFIGFDWDAWTLACLLLFMGAMGKSAQFLLHTWLPDAMEGPTPVSALIHAATMVTAGVFMVARLSPLFELSSTALSFVLIIGATTAFFAATVGLVQNDIKRVIAYSTCSQLGYMFVGLGVGGYSLGIFHLFTHAFFKALLFLGAGSVITAMHHEQDMRRMGGLRTEIPFTFWMMMIGTLALTGVGIPFTPLGFAGYVSKDAIIEAAFASHRYGAVYAYWCVTIAAALHLVLLLAPHVHDLLRRARPVFVLAAGAGAGRPRARPRRSRPWPRRRTGARIAAGHADPARGAGVRRRRSPAWRSATGSSAPAIRDFWRNALFLGPDNDILEEMEHVPALVSLSPTLMMIVGLLIAAYMYLLDRKARRAARAALPGRFTGSCSTSGTSTSSTTSCSSGRPSPSAARSGRAATARSSTAWGRTAYPPACST